jgi:hypothetical protein
MESDFIRVELIEDPAAILECCFNTGTLRNIRVCDRCGDDDAWIVAILVVPAGGDSYWGLCDGCVSEMPRHRLLC